MFLLMVKRLGKATMVAILGAALIDCSSSKPPESFGVKTIISRRTYLASSSPQLQAAWNSYVLLPRAPESPEDTLRYVQLHKAFKTVFRPQTVKMVAGKAGSEMNRVYWLTTVDPGKSPDSLSDTFFVENYDYARARDFIERLDGSQGQSEWLSGVYVFFDQDTLLNTRRSWEGVFKVDLSNIHPDRYLSQLAWLREHVNEDPGWKLAWLEWKARINHMLERQGPRMARRKNDCE